MNESLGQKTFLEEEESVEILPLLMAVYKRWFAVVLAALVIGFAFWLGSHLFLTPTYRTSCRVYVNNMLDSSEKTSVSSSDLTASRSLAGTYAEIISGRTVLEEAARRVGVEQSYASLSRNITVTTGTSSEIITIAVVGRSPEAARGLAKSIVEVAQDHVASIVDGSSMRVIDEPFLPQSIYSPNYMRNAVLGAMLGAVLAVALIVLLTLLDNRVKDEDALEKRYGIVVLGSIPDFEEAGKVGSYDAYGTSRKDAEVRA